MVGASVPLEKTGTNGAVLGALFTRKDDGKYSQNTNVNVPAATADLVNGQQLHPQAQDILRQVHYYFDDDNLRSDEHLLALTGNDGNGPVNISEICGFRMMRKYRPLSAVTSVLATSDKLEVIDNKQIKRRYPLTMPLTVQPKRHDNKLQVQPLADKPHLTKKMLKPTGFEEDFIEGPIEPSLYKKEREWYHPSLSIDTRIEKAVQRFAIKRTFHQATKRVFDAWMLFGGINNRPRQFQGDVDFTSAEYDKYDKEEIADRSNRYAVNESVTYGLGEIGTAGTTWVVGFEDVAKAFLSTQLVMGPYLCETKEQIFAATNVMRTFYRYLELHDVCPEYKEDLVAARAVCDLADKELPDMLTLGKYLPGQFNIACSTLNKGHYAGLHSSHAINEEWAAAVDKSVGLSDQDATAVLAIHSCLWVDEADEDKVIPSLKGDGKVVSSEEVRMKIVSVERATDKQASIFKAPQIQGSFLKKTGKITCKRCELPFAAPVDLPPAILKRRAAQTLEFYVEDETLDLCVPGMGIWAVVKELDVGIKWLDTLLEIYPTFFLDLPNERIMDYKEPGPPTAWMLRQTEKSVDGDSGKM